MIPRQIRHDDRLVLEHAVTEARDRIGRIVSLCKALHVDAQNTRLLLEEITGVLSRLARAEDDAKGRS
jgi:hypothetical protein